MTRALRILSLILCLSLVSLSAFADDTVFDDEINIMEEQPTFGGADVETNVYGDLKTEGTISFKEIEDKNLRHKADVLYNLGFISCYSDGTFRVDAKITKGDFICSVLSLLNFQYEKDATDIYTPAIETAYSLGIVVGDENNRIDPNEYISNTDASTILVRAFGYEDLAKFNGGYPTGYLGMAKKIGLYMTNSSQLTRGDACKLLYSALDVAVMKRVTYGEVSQFEAYENKTVLSVYHNIYRVDNRVNASYISALPKYNITDSDMLTIGDKDYFTEDTKLSEFLGYYVEAYYTDVNGTDEIVYITKSLDLEVFVIKAQDIIRFNNLKYDYYIGNKEKSKEIAEHHTLIVNGIVEEVYGDSDFIPVNGDVKLLSYKNNICDVVMIETFFPFLLDGVNTDISGNPQFLSKFSLPLYKLKLNKDVNFSLYVNDVKCSFYSKRIETYDPDGNAIVQYSLPALPKDCIVNIFADKYTTVNGFTIPAQDAKLVTFKIYTGREISGTVNATAQDKIVIDGISYDVAKRNLFSLSPDDITVGVTGRYILDYDGRICAFLSEDDAQELEYAYLINAVCDPKPMQDKAEAKLLLSNGEIKIFDISEKVKINGVKAISAGAVITSLNQSAAYIKDSLNFTISQLIKYKCNTKGEISKIETVLQSVNVPSDTDKDHIHREAVRATYASRSENGNSLYFKSGNYTGMLAYNGKPGFHFKVPKTETFNDADYSVSTSWGVNMSEKVLDVYNASDNLVPEVIVEYSDVDPALDYPYVLVESTGQGFDEKGNVVGVLNCVTGHTNTGWLLEDGKKVYYSYDTDLFSGLKCGDFIYLYGTGNYISKYDMKMPIDTVKAFNFSVMPTPAEDSQKYDLYELYAIWKSYNFILQRGPVTTGTKRAYQQINYFNKLVDYGGFVYDARGREPKVSALFSTNVMDAAINSGNEKASKVYIWESSTVTKLMVVYIGI